MSRVSLLMCLACMGSRACRQRLKSCLQPLSNRRRRRRQGATPLLQSQKRRRNCSWKPQERRVRPHLRRRPEHAKQLRRGQWRVGTPSVCFPLLSCKGGHFGLFFVLQFFFVSLAVALLFRTAIWYKRASPPSPDNRETPSHSKPTSTTTVCVL